MILVAQVSDTHIDLGSRNTERAEVVMAYLAGLRRKPDLILITGDVTDSGKPDQYAEARTALTADVPLRFLPGNHDERAAFREVLLGEPASSGPINGAVRVGDLTIVLLDSTIPGEAGGLLGDETFAFLRETLAAAPADGPVLLAMHHPPVHLHSPIIDGITLAEPERLAEVITGDPRVIGVLTGHAHSAATTTFAGRPLLVAPSTASVLGGEWELELPGHVMDYAPDPAVALHIVDENGALTTHFRPVPMGGFLGEQP
ncbi:metallophosphoesterase [Nocardia puris]|uniref:3',5'-cyclic AMP phosphodiesterase CpdA n=1 Tax=Nocardia puris TaxID=208602 RepID=A0A366D9Y3_9NOCA|nr:metallophosphoesterase [Nocardia puris]MBF6211676.1 metallophosphoesterase [Nocardia puris]MBF6365680.1 metallophosphoesterase [Nocardia puris]MBF6460678.1 metallophosphoesterase [Nocardia puris]RBO86850.1 3',5'-cyclic AMP phosphodiesterase CpdA [Nocardia puris]